MQNRPFNSVKSQLCVGQLITSNIFWHFMIVTTLNRNTDRVCGDILPCFCLSEVSQSLRSEAPSDQGPDWRKKAETSVKHPRALTVRVHICMKAYVLPVEFLNGMSGGFPDVRWKVGGCFFDGQHHDGDDYGNSDTGQDSESARSDQLIRILHTQKWWKRVKLVKYRQNCHYMQKGVEHNGRRLGLHHMGKKINKKS